MRHRCISRWRKDFVRYGGRGISVCERWCGPEGFTNFLADMGERPPGTSLERKDNNLGYMPENCVWASAKQQANNTRRNRIILLGDQKMTMTQAAGLLGIKMGTLWMRVKRGWSIERAISTEIRRP
jgi:hypothetical protein